MFEDSKSRRSAQGSSPRLGGENLCGLPGQISGWRGAEYFNLAFELLAMWGSVPTWRKLLGQAGRLEPITREALGAQTTSLKAWAESCYSSGFPPEGTVHLCPVGCPQAWPVTRRRDSRPHGQEGRSSALGFERIGPLEKELAELARPKGKLAEVPRERGRETGTGEDRASIKTGSRCFKGGPLDPTEGNSSNMSIDSQDSGHPCREGHGVRQLAQTW